MTASCRTRGFVPVLRSRRCPVVPVPLSVERNPVDNYQHPHCRRSICDSGTVGAVDAVGNVGAIDTVGNVGAVDAVGDGGSDSIRIAGPLSDDASRDSSSRRFAVAISIERANICGRTMSRPELDAASDTLYDAAEVATPELATQLAETAETVADLAHRDAGPDHGRLARLEYKLRGFTDSGSTEVADRVETALEHVREYRKTVEGV